ncbi:Disease resistance response protein 206 [Platanthera zijinensis]|uniref:Dirigent protein n=1 Tax=Platanthera zijinensis TaxID=2320716 RepID=A0AAP0BF83_9ASPA
MATVVVFLLFLLPLLSHHLTAAVSSSGSGGTRLRFFWHDISAGPDPSAVLVAQSATRSSSSFGTVKVMDDPLTAGPNRSSLLVGKSQGIYVSADKETAGLLMAMTFSFVVGKYNGSTLAVVGRNEVKTETREMAITGGTGQFRQARGHAQARTHSFDPTTD